MLDRRRREEATKAEWLRLIRHPKFMATASAELITDYDKFVKEFGLTPRPEAILIRMSGCKAWTAYTTYWG